VLVYQPCVDLVRLGYEKTLLLFYTPDTSLKGVSIQITMQALRFLLLLVAVVSVSLSVQSCKKDYTFSEEVNQNRIETYFELFYDNVNDSTFTTAQFGYRQSLISPGASRYHRLELNDGSSISFEGQAMEWNASTEQYELSLPAGSGVSSGTFSYTDNEGNSFDNLAETNPINFTAVLDSIPTDSNYTVA
jgi:hypothetical protein